MINFRVNPEVYIRRALIKAQAGKTEQAERLLCKALEQIPEHVNTMLLLGDMLAGGERYDDALHWYKKAHALESQNPEILYRIGMLLGARRRYEEAIVWYERALRHVNTRQRKLMADCWMNMGVSQWQMRMYNQAFTSWETALRYDPELEKARYFLQELSNDYGQPRQRSGAMNDVAAFRKIKLDQYFQEKGAKSFQTAEEAAEVLSSISEAWLSVSDAERFRSMTAAEKIRLFKETPLNIS